MKQGMIGRLTRAAVLAAGCLFLFCPNSAHAVSVNYSFTGSLADDDDVQFFSFDVDATSLVTLRTYSYAGGVMADGTVIPNGGFDPILSVFNSTGVKIGANDDGSSSQVGTDPVTLAHFDTYLQVLLNPGSYFVSVSQYNNFAGATMQAAFARTGNFTAPWCPGGQGSFCDVTEHVRNGNWAFDVLNVARAELTPVPEPATAVLLACAGVAGLRARRRRQRA